MNIKLYFRLLTTTNPQHHQTSEAPLGPQAPLAVRGVVAAPPGVKDEDRLHTYISLLFASATAINELLRAVLAQPMIRRCHSGTIHQPVKVPPAHSGIALALPGTPQPTLRAMRAGAI